jgi:hypothetical protein
VPFSVLSYRPDEGRMKFFSADLPRRNWYEKSGFCRLFISKLSQKFNAKTALKLR